MPTLVLCIDPGDLDHPDADIRYVLPERIREYSEGVIQEDGYDYEEGSDALLIFVKCPDPESAEAKILELLRAERILDNDLTGKVEIRSGER